MRFPGMMFVIAAAATPATAMADEVISDDLIVQNSVCAGVDCVDGEEFGFDTLKLKSPRPGIVFDDTSSSGSFPASDWQIGVSDDATATPANFVIRNITNNVRALLLTPDGDVALGAGSEAEFGAVSVGAQGNERRVIHVANAVQGTDAVNLQQFEAFKNSVRADYSTERNDLDQRLDDLDNRVSDLTDRVDAIVAELEDGSGRGL